MQPKRRCSRQALSVAAVTAAAGSAFLQGAFSPSLDWLSLSTQRHHVSSSSSTAPLPGHWSRAGGCVPTPQTWAAARRAPRRSGTKTARSAQVDPDFRANVGEAIDALRTDHSQLPGATPGITVVDDNVELTLAQVPSLSFTGRGSYSKFWSDFRAGVELVSEASRSEVLQVVHSGLYIRIRWQLLLQPREMAGSKAVVSALQQARTNALGSGPGWLQDAGASFMDGVEQWGKAAQEERRVDLNSVYELDPWSGRVIRHTLEFRSPEEDFGLLGAMQGVPSMR
mmetsp:Transcript_52373/g.125082  ORF Transcript_52373/g.125082 Transcript_52373/m.125082 type:complete len:283 (+) Transcript_52373:73-921(+)